MDTGAQMAELARMDQRLKHQEQALAGLQQDVLGDHSTGQTGGRVGRLEQRFISMERKLDRAMVALIVMVTMSAFLSGSGTFSLKQLILFMAK